VDARGGSDDGAPPAAGIPNICVEALGGSVGAAPPDAGAVPADGTPNIWVDARGGWLFERAGWLCADGAGTPYICVDRDGFDGVAGCGG
jgi:hypothetical protein